MADSAHDAYAAGLTMLARRELSEAQVRQRLLRKGHDASAVEAAVERLKQERALEDVRVAEAIVRTEAVIRGRGRLRADQRLKRAGIASDTAKRAIDQVYGELDADRLLADAVAKRLRGRTGVRDRREAASLYRYLTGRGFESDRVLAVIDRLSRGGPPH